MNKKLIFKPHPWHGIPVGKGAPGKLTAFIEMVPSDTCKYEIDKYSGYLKIDRPQKFSNIIPALYGFIPQTYCGKKTADFAGKKSGKKLKGDCDPLDICVFTEREIPHGDILVEVKVIGGMRMIDGGEADDKIVAVLAQDEVYNFTDIKEAPERLVNRLKHYFLTYKQLPGSPHTECEITHIYGSDEAKKVVQLSLEDYKDEFSE